MDASEVRAAVAENKLWYHTLDLPGGVTTPGWFDLRGVVDQFPWPDVKGKRCLDIATYDGFFAFELEKRGAAEVVATDIPTHADWDWPPDVKIQGPAKLAEIAGKKGEGFEIAKKALGSAVERVWCNVYDVSPERLGGKFDVVICGALMLHLQDPLRALQAIKSVVGEQFLSIEQVDLSLSLLHRRRPLAQLNGSGELLQWWVPNVAGHRRMLFAAGFKPERSVGPLAGAFGSAHPPRPKGFAGKRRAALERLMAKGEGVPTAAVLSRHRF